MFYTGYTTFADQQEVHDFQNFLHGQLRFNGRYAVNDVYQEFPDPDFETQNDSGQDMDAVRLLSHLAPVRNSNYLVSILQNFFPLSLTMRSNKLEGLPLETLSSQVLEFEGKTRADPIGAPVRCFLLG